MPAKEIDAPLLSRRAKRWIAVAAGVIALAAACVLWLALTAFDYLEVDSRRLDSAVWSDPDRSATARCEMSDDALRQIQTGMPIEQVMKLLGGEPDYASDRQIHYYLGGCKSFIGVSDLVVEFEGGRVTQAFIATD